MKDELSKPFVHIHVRTCTYNMYLQLVKIIICYKWAEEELTNVTVEDVEARRVTDETIWTHVETTQFPGNRIVTAAQTCIYMYARM